MSATTSSLRARWVFNLSYFIGVISGPFWALLTGYLMERAGFSQAVAVLGFSYLAGMLLLLLARNPLRGSSDGTTRQV